MADDENKMYRHLDREKAVMGKGPGPGGKSSGAAGSAGRNKLLRELIKTVKTTNKAELEADHQNLMASLRVTKKGQKQTQGYRARSLIINTANGLFSRKLAKDVESREQFQRLQDLRGEKKAAKLDQKSQKANISAFLEIQEGVAKTVDRLDTLIEVGGGRGAKAKRLKKEALERLDRKSEERHRKLQGNFFQKNSKSFGIFSKLLGLIVKPIAAFPEFIRRTSIFTTFFTRLGLRIAGLGLIAGGIIKASAAGQSVLQFIGSIFENVNRAVGEQGFKKASAGFFGTLISPVTDEFGRIGEGIKSQGLFPFIQGEFTSSIERVTTFFTVTVPKFFEDINKAIFDEEGNFTLIKTLRVAIVDQLQILAKGLFEVIKVGLIDLGKALSNTLILIIPKTIDLLLPILGDLIETLFPKRGKGAADFLRRDFDLTGMTSRFMSRTGLLFGVNPDGTFNEDAPMANQLMAQTLGTFKTKAQYAEEMGFNVPGDKKVESAVKEYNKAVANFEKQSEDVKRLGQLTITNRRGLVTVNPLFGSTEVIAADPRNQTEFAALLRQQKTEATQAQFILNGALATLQRAIEASKGASDLQRSQVQNISNVEYNTSYYESFMSNLGAVKPRFEY